MRRGRTNGRCHNGSVAAERHIRFLRMKPGHGEILLAEGDPRVREEEERLVELPGERYPGGSAHGSGCTHSSALAAHLARGLDPLDAAKAAKRIASEAVRDGLRDIGAGPGPVDVLGLGTRDA